MHGIIEAEQMKYDSDNEHTHTASQRSSSLSQRRITSVAAEVEVDGRSVLFPPICPSTTNELHPINLGGSIDRRSSR